MEFDFSHEKKMMRDLVLFIVSWGLAYPIEGVIFGQFDKLSHICITVTIYLIIYMLVKKGMALYLTGKNAEKKANPAKNEKKTPNHQPSAHMQNEGKKIKDILSQEQYYEILGLKECNDRKMAIQMVCDLTGADYKSAKNFVNSL